jgi:imidazolonepropionase
MVDILIKGKEILTLKNGVRKGKEIKNLGIIYDGIVAIEAGKIVFVGEEKYKDKFNAKIEIDASNNVVMPAFIDAHTHLLFYGSREDEYEMIIKGYSYSEILKKGGGIWKTVRLTKQAKEEEIMKETIQRIEKFIENGITTIEIKSGYGIDYEEEIKQLKIINKIKNQTCTRIVPTLLAHLPKENREEYVNGFCKLLRYVYEEKLAKFVDVFCDVGAFNCDEAERIFSEAEKLGFLLKIHAGEIANTGCGKLFQKFKFTSADHLIFLNEEDVKSLVENNICGVLLPATSFSLMHQNANARKYIDKGMIIALATDFSPINQVYGMENVIAIACRNLRMSQAECITATTINAAYALNLHNILGSLEENKLADIIIMNVPNYKWIGYTIGYNHVITVMKEGKIIKEN